MKVEGGPATERLSDEVDENVVVRLTDWPHEPSIQQLMHDHDKAKPTHDRVVSEVNSWRDLIEVTGKEVPKTLPNRSTIQPKTIRRQNEWRYSALTEPFLGSDKLFEVKPVTASDKAAAIQNELLLNHQFRTYVDMVPFIDEYVRTAVDEGTVILRTGWCRIEEEVEVEVPTWNMVAPPSPEGLARLRQALMAAQQAPEQYEQSVPEDLRAAVEHYQETGQAVEARPGPMTKRKEKRVVANHPTVDILDPRNVRIDPSCGSDFRRANFYTYTFESSYADLKKDGRYHNLDKIHIESANPHEDAEHTSQVEDQQFQFQDKARKRLLVHEYWGFYDVHGNGVLTPIVAAWVGNTLIRMEENPFPDKQLNLVVVNYLPRKRSVYGETDANLLGDYQRIQGALWRGINDLLGRSANSQRGMAKGLLDPVNMTRYNQGLDYFFNPTQHPNNGIVEHKYPDVPQSAIGLLQMTNQEAEAITGVKSFTGGMSGDAFGKVAAGIRGMLDAASKREMAILRRLSRGIVEVGRKFVAMNAVFLSEEEIVRVTEEEFVPVRRDELAGKFDLIVDISTAEVDDAQAQDLAFMLQTMGPNLGMGMVQMILSEIARLKRMPDLAKAIKEFQPPQDPIEEAKKQLELKEAQAKIAKLEAEAEEARMRAKKAKAEADKLDLDYLEQADGIKHERDMEKQAGQARGNANLEIVKNLAKPKKVGEMDGDLEAAIGYNALTDANPGNVGAGMPLPPPPLDQQVEMPLDFSGLLEDPNATPVDSALERDALANQEPELNLNSSAYDPTMDPSANQRLNM